MNTPDDGLLTHVAHQIAALEARTSEQIATLLESADNDQDTSKVEVALWDNMEALLSLRRQQWQVRTMMNGAVEEAVFRLPPEVGSGS